MGSLASVLHTFVSLRRTARVSSDQFTFATVLSASAKLAAVRVGKQVHCDALKMGFTDDSFCGGSLIDMYGKCGLVEDSRKMLDQMQCMDEVAWTSMIAGYVRVGMPEEALVLFNRMLDEGCAPDMVTTVTAITACMALGKIQDAEVLFMGMSCPNEIAWNAMISGFTRNGRELDALDFFNQMHRAGLRPTRSTLGSVLHAAADLVDILPCLQVHSLAIKSGLAGNVFVGSSLINTYAKFHLIEEARNVFDALIEKNLVSWNAMLGGYVHNERPREVVELFLHMKERGVGFDDFTCVSLFSACACLEDLKLGQQLHAVAMKKNFARAVFVGNSIIDMYSKSKDLDSAERLFMFMPTRDVVTWNAFIAGLVNSEYNVDAFNMLSMMILSGLVPDDVSISMVLSACACKEASGEGKQLHCLSIKVGLERNMYVGSSIVNFYAKSEDILAAERAYILFPDKSVASKNAMIEGYVLNNRPDEALRCFQKLLNEGTHPTIFTFASVLHACTHPVASYLGVQLHCHILKSGLLSCDVFLGIALINMYLKSERYQVVEDLLVELPYNRNPVLWTVVISWNNENNAECNGLLLFSKMRHRDVLPDQATFVSVLRACADLSSLKDGEKLHVLVICMGYAADISVCSSLIDMYSKCGDVKESHRIFNEVKNKNSIVLWNSMLVGFAKNGFADNALMLFRQMEELNIQLDDISFLGVLTACSHAGLVSEGRSIFYDMSRKYGSKPRYDHYACMVDLLGRGGFLDEAEKLINEMPFQSESVIWSTLISSCKLHGDHARAGRAAEMLMKLDPESSSSYVLLSNLCAMSGNWDGVKLLRRIMNEKEVRKSPGCSWIVVGDNTRYFVSADTSNSDVTDIYEALASLTDFMKKNDQDNSAIFLQDVA